MSGKEYLKNAQLLNEKRGAELADQTNRTMRPETNTRQTEALKNLNYIIAESDRLREERDEALRIAGFGADRLETISETNPEISLKQDIAHIRRVIKQNGGES